MKWKKIAWLGRFNSPRVDVNGMSDPSPISTRNNHRFFKRHLKRVSEALGETSVKRFINHALYSKSCYLVFESPHASLPELSGNAVSEVSGGASGGIFGRSNGHEHEGRAPRWYVEGSSLYLSMHFENDVYSENQCFDRYLATLLSELKVRRSGPRLSGAMVYLHQHDLVHGLSVSWLNQMSSMLVSACEKANQSIPVYLVIEGVSDNDINTSLSLLNTPIGMFRDYHSVNNENFGEWFSQACDEIKHRLLRKSLQEVQYVHNLESRRHAFIALSGVDARLGLLKNLAEDFNHRWHFSRHPSKPWIRALFLATEGVSVDPSRMISPTTGELGADPAIQTPTLSPSPLHYRWWQKFSHLLESDRYCGSPDKHQRTYGSWAFNSVIMAVALCLVIGIQQIWGDQKASEVLGARLSDQMRLFRHYPEDGSTAASYELIVDRLSELEVISDELETDESRVAVFTNSVAETGIEESRRQSDRILQEVFGRQLNADLLRMLDESEAFEELYSALKAYLHLHMQREGRNDYLMWWFGREWQVQYADDSRMRTQLANHLSALLSEPKVLEPVDAGLVATVRAKLRSMPLHKRLYADITQRAQERAPSSPLLKDIIGYQQSSLFVNGVQGVPPFYTVKGYRSLFEPQLKWVLQKTSKDQWVLGEENSLGDERLTLEEDIYRLYVDDYRREWNRLLKGLNVNQTNSLDELQRVVQLSMGKTGTFRRLLQYVYDNTAVFNSLPQVGISGLANIGSSIAPSSVSKVITATSAGEPNKNGLTGYWEAHSSLGRHPMVAISEHFEDLNSVLKKPVDNHSEMESIDLGLILLDDYLGEFARADGRGIEVFEASVKKMNGQRNDPASQLIKSSKSMPEPLGRWVSDLSSQSWMHMISRTRTFVRNAYQNELYDRYKAHLRSRYPLSTQSKNDIETDHFTEYFKPKGEENRFFLKYVKPFVMYSGSDLYEKKVGGIRLGFSKRYLSQLRVAQSIRERLFEEGELFTEMKFQPIYLDANISRFDLSVMGDRLSYRHGPQTVSKVSWPSPSGSNEITMMFEDYNGNKTREVFSGDWSLFRLIERYGKESMPGERRYRMSFESKGQRAVYETAGKALTPDFLKLLGKYQLPKTPLI